MTFPLGTHLKTAGLAPVMHGATLKSLAAAVLIGLLFLSISLGLIASGRGIPAVFDGNETFSSILHARNLLAFGPGASAGLADESTSSRPEAHPVVHTHQGNFPRLFATLLFAVGLDSPASQVAATVLPVGTLSILVLFWALRRYSGTGIAVATLAILVTDYILFAQWQVVTYRVWHFAFVSALLAVAIWYREEGDRRFLVATFFISTILFYFELVFAAFLSVSISVFVLLLWRREIVSGVMFVVAQLLGALTGVAICMAQLVAYLGWDNFVSDLRLTYLARNAGIDDPARLAELRAFMEQNNIAFFYNFVDGSNFRSVGFVLDSIFRWGLQVYTPPFAYALLILAFSVVIALLASRGAVRSPKYAVIGLAAITAFGWLLGSSSIVFLIALGMAVAIIVAVDQKAPPQLVGHWSAALIVGAPAFVLVLMAATFSRFGGYERGDAGAWSYGLAFALALGALAALLVLRDRSERGQVPLDAVLRGASVICVAVVFSRFHYGLYDQPLAPLWAHAVPGPFAPPGLQSAAMIVATGCAAMMAAFGPYLPDDIRMPLRRAMRQAAKLLAALFAGFLVVVMLFPGYVYSGYMVRYLNFMVLSFALIIGFVLYAMIRIAMRHTGEGARRRPSFFPLGATCAVASVLLVSWWALVQVANARLFPATGFAVLRALDAMRPLQPTIVTNTYPVPFSVTTGQWSFADETFSSGRTVFSLASGYQYDFDRKYLWFADRTTNPEYSRPDLFVCLLTPSFHSVALEVAKSHKRIRCADNGVVQAAFRHADKTWPQHSILAHDASGRDSWAIVKLDWDFPPFLSAAPAISATLQGDNVAVTVNYAFRHQDGKPEYQTDIEIRTVSRNGSFCAVEGTALASRTVKGGQAVFAIPQSDIGKGMIAIVRPLTSTRIGKPVFTAPFRIDGQGAIAFGSPCSLLRDAGGQHWSRLEGD